MVDECFPTKHRPIRLFNDANIHNTQEMKEIIVCQKPTPCKNVVNGSFKSIGGRKESSVTKSMIVRDTLFLDNR